MSLVNVFRANDVITQDRINDAVNHECTVTYDGNDNITRIDTEVLSTLRRRVNFTYDASDNLTEREEILYDTDGTTVLSTTTITYTYDGDDNITDWEGVVS